LQQIRNYGGPDNAGICSGQCLHNSGNAANKKRSLIFGLKNETRLRIFSCFIAAVAANVQQTAENKGDVQQTGGPSCDVPP